MRSIGKLAIERQSNGCESLLSPASQRGPAAACSRARSVRGIGLTDRKVRRTL